jgi:hypothetical protein
MNNLLLALAVVSATIQGADAWAQVGSATMNGQKRAAAENGPDLYGTVELRHHINTFYEDDGYRGPQEPSGHLRLQAGAQMYEQKVDVYATVGVYKIPRTQQVRQRRPEIAADFYPWRDRYFTLLQYNIVRLPFDEREQDPDVEDFEGADAGSIYIMGLAPTVKYPFIALNSEWKIKGGLDAWSKLYTRKQYTEEYDQEFRDPVTDETRFRSVNVETDEDQEPIEDYAMHGNLLTMVGFDFEPGLIHGFSSEATVNYNRKFVPRYSRNDNGTTEHEYGVDDYSFYRLRAKYEINERVAIVNDFYHFHGGFFEAKRDGDSRRYRNIARITCRL